MKINNSIRVLHFADLINRFDFIDNIVRHLDPTRFEREVATFHGRSNIEPPEYETDGIRHTVLNVHSRRAYPLAAARLRSLVRERGVSIVHPHHYEPNAVAWLATQLEPSVRVVVGRHYSDAIYRNTSGLRRHGYLALERLVNRHAARIVAPSTMIQSLLVERQAVPARKVEVIPYAFDPRRYKPPAQDDRRRRRVELGIASSFAVATVGRLYRDKGHRYLLEAVCHLAEDLPDLVWLVVGDGPERAPLERAINQARLGERVRLLGWRTDALRIIGAVDAVVQPSLQEAYSQVMAESLWMRTPLVISDVSGATDLITNGENGFVVPKADARALACAIQKLYYDSQLREQLGRAGRSHMEKYYSIDRIVPLYEALYEDVFASIGVR
jgi:glycosyltransferase involved in cell wall biosynthesis